VKTNGTDVNSWTSKEFVSKRERKKKNPSKKLISNYLSRNNDGRTTENFVSSQDERLHWDLNVSMDAWEKPVFESKGIAGVLSSRVDGRYVLMK